MNSAYSTSPSILIGNGNYGVSSDSEKIERGGEYSLPTRGGGPIGNPYETYMKLNSKLRRGSSLTPDELKWMRDFESTRSNLSDVKIG